LPIPRELARVVFVNGIRQEPDWVLREGDEVGIFPPIAGGHPNPA
jgi:molybdopterin converting factor small subunit